MAPILTWGAASSSASGPPSSAASRADASSAPKAPEVACGAAGSGGPVEGAGPGARLKWGGGGWRGEVEAREEPGMAVAYERSGE